jgi:hypothetical protein
MIGSECLFYVCGTSAKVVGHIHQALFIRAFVGRVDQLHDIIQYAIISSIE